MSGGLADSVTIATPITNIDPIVINRSLSLSAIIFPFNKYGYERAGNVLDYKHVNDPPGH